MTVACVDAITGMLIRFNEDHINQNKEVIRSVAGGGSVPIVFPF